MNSSRGGNPSPEPITNDIAVSQNNDLLVSFFTALVNCLLPFALVICDFFIREFSFLVEVDSKVDFLSWLTETPLAI